jgi:hypothetical protein
VSHCRILVPDSATSPLNIFPPHVVLIFYTRYCSGGLSYGELQLGVWKVSAVCMPCLC